MNIYHELLCGGAALSVVGLGYVGLPLAVAFAHYCPVIGYDANPEKIGQLRRGEDPTMEVGPLLLGSSCVRFTSNPDDLKQAKFHIIAVPTPIFDDCTPNLEPLKQASLCVGRRLGKGSVVVYESTVYPGATEEICIPLLEQASGLKCGEDFAVGYSPERINPGDPLHRLENIVKVVSATGQEALEEIERVYRLVVQAGVHRAPSILVAEAAKVIENSQRDINIAFMNELSMIFHRLGIDTGDVLAAAKTKWNFLPFTPGLVGGHCIGVDPYYLTHCAQKAGHRAQVILAGRSINDNMGKYIAETLVKALIHQGSLVKNACIGILGVTFKENCPDTRNSRVMDIAAALKEYGAVAKLYDPQADKEEFARQYPGYCLCAWEELKNLDAVVIAVAHRSFACLTPTQLASLYRQPSQEGKILFDIKGLLPRYSWRVSGYDIWRL